MGKQSYAEYLKERGAGLIPKTPPSLDERETGLWDRCVDLIRDHLGRWPERYQECGSLFGLLAKGLSSNGTCAWVLDDATDSCLWETGCGQAFQFTDGGPEDNLFRYCYKCGKEIEAVRTTEDEEDEEAADAKA